MNQPLDRIEAGTDRGTYTLAYLSYQTGPHVPEIVFSLLSAIRHRKPTDRFQIAIVTDDAEPFAGLPAGIVPISKTEMDEWAGPMQFGHRRKILALRKIIQLTGGPTVLLDGDTYFRRSPQLLFDRLSPGRSLMHVRKGKLGLLAAHGHMRNRLPGIRAVLSDGERFDLQVDTVICNAGVVGIHPSDLPLLEKVVQLTNQIHASAASWLSEQVAFSMVLQRHTTLAGCRDVVFHYHEKIMRAPFRQNLPAWLTETQSMSLAERADFLHRFRPIPPFQKTVKAFIKRHLKKVGFFQRDLQTSV